MNIKIKMLVWVAACSGLLACQKNESEQNSVPSVAATSAQRPAAGENAAEGKSGWLPPGAMSRQQNDRIIITGPQGWEYIGTDIKGQSVKFLEHASTSVTCTCNSSGTCKPFLATGPWGDTSGCTGTCTQCSMSKSNSLSPDNTQMLSGGYYQPGAATRLLKNGEYAPAVFNELFQTDAFQQKLKALYQEAYRGMPYQQPEQTADGWLTAPKGYSIVGVLIMGRGLAVILPEAFVTKNLGYAVHAKASCSCSNSSGACTLKDKSILGMGSMWCEGTCNGCTLKTNSYSDGSSYEVNIKAFAF